MTLDRSQPNEMDSGTLQIGASMLCGLLGRILFNYPERGLLQPILEHDLFEEVPFAAGQPDVTSGQALLEAWSKGQSGQIAEETLDELRADYTRLFIGPGRVIAPPWESVHRNVDRLLFQEETLQVRDWYRRFQLEAVSLHREPDDHVGLELNFLSNLATVAAEAAENRDEVTLSRLIAAERAFLAEHPVNWVPMWCELVVREAHTDFYRGVALVTRGALAELAELLGVAIPPWSLDQI